MTIPENIPKLRMRTRMTIRTSQQKNNIKLGINLFMLSQQIDLNNGEKTEFTHSSSCSHNNPVTAAEFECFSFVLCVCMCVCDKYTQISV